MTNALPEDGALSTDLTRFCHFSFSTVGNLRKKYLYHNWDQKPTHLTYLAIPDLFAVKIFAEDRALT